MKDRRQDDKESSAAPIARRKPARMELRIRGGFRVDLGPGLEPEDIFRVEKETPGGMKTKGSEVAGEAKGGRGLALEDVAVRCCKPVAAVADLFEKGKADPAFAACGFAGELADVVSGRMCAAGCQEGVGDPVAPERI